MALSTGNVVVAAPFDDAGGVDAGAVYLFNGSTGALISTLVGSGPGDKIGSGGVVGLTNGNFVVISPNWDNGAFLDVGAITWGSGTSGVNGVVSDANSLIGSTNGDSLGSKGVVALTSGNYVVSSPLWDNGAAVDAGAATWGNGKGGSVGAVSVANSLVGTTSGDSVSNEKIIALSSGNYVVISASWDNGTKADAGAVSWGSGETGVKGAVSAANSLIGNSAGDMVGVGGVVTLPNGNYVVRSTVWNNGANTAAGAATWGNGVTGTVGLVSAANSLVGSKTNDNVGNHGIFALSNGNYIVCSPTWDNGSVVDVGACTWGNGTTGTVGLISAANSLVGSTPSDNVGSDATVLTNGNYVVRSSAWDNGKTGTDAGAVTWGNGTTGTVGVVAVSNSLVGETLGDNVGIGGIVALKNGNYVVRSFYWDSGTAVDGGAVTWGNGATGTVGAVSAANSLIGAKAMDYVGMGNVVALTNGNYVVASHLWDNGAVSNAGAVTWGNGATGTSGVVGPTNSLVGSMTDDFVGLGANGVVALANGNYVVTSYLWDNGAKTNAGAVTWGNGFTGSSGPVSVSNSLYGVNNSDNVGGTGIVPLVNGNYVVRSAVADVDGISNAGAATWGNGAGGTIGPITKTNSLVGSRNNDSISIDGVVAFANGNYAVVSSSYDNGGIVNAGAVSWGSGVGGVVGYVVAAPSLIGFGANSKLQAALTLDSINNNYMGRFVAEGGGRVRIGSQMGAATGTLSAQLVSGDLVITDTSSTGINNRITVTYTNGDVVITDENDTFTGGPVGSKVSGDGKTLTVPGTAFSGKIILNTQLGADTVTVDKFAVELTRTVVVNGGASVDQLLLTRADLASLAINYANTSDGVIIADPLGDDPPQSLTFTDIEPMDLSGVSADEVMFNLPATATNAILEDAGSVGDGKLRLRSAQGALTPVTFASPRARLSVIDAGSDNLTVTAVPDFSRSLVLGSTASPLSSIEFNGELTIAPSFSLSVFAANSLTLASQIRVLGGDCELRCGGVITQTAGAVIVEGTLTVQTGAGQAATFANAGNAATALVVPVGSTLIVNGAFDTNGAVQVAGTLGGFGVVGPVTLTETGRLGAGGFVNRLITGDIAFNPGSAFALTLNDSVDYDQLTVNGQVNLGGASLSVALGFAPSMGQSFTILENKPGFEPVIGQLAGYAEGSFLTVDGQSFLLSYYGGDGNDVTLTRTDVPPAPTVEFVALGNGAQRSIVKQVVVTFSEQVNFAGLAAGAFRLRRTGTGGTVGDVTLHASPATGPTQSVTLTFSGPLTQSGSLIDGKYDFTIDASKVFNLGGPLDGNNDGSPGGNFSIVGTTANKWYRLFGDTNGDGFTDNVDLIAFRQANGSNSALGNFNPALDFNGDGFIDNIDFVAFRQRLGAVV